MIVGAGSAGCVLAARLTANPHHRVTLLEAGPDYPDPGRLPHDLVDATRNSMRKHDWHLQHVPTPQTMRFPFPRGRVVGGSSAVNTCIAVRGTRRDFDEWGELGLEDWNWDACLPAFTRLERDLDFGDRDHHGADGPLPLRRHPPSEWKPWQAAFHEAVLSLGYAEIEDHNEPDAQGLAPHSMNKLDGRRISAAEAWLTAAVRRRPNLTIQPDTTVHRIRFDQQRAIGADVEHRGARYAMGADRVVLCAGAIQTPALLLRSGLGPSKDLRRLGIEPRCLLPTVGSRLLDHPGFAMFLRPRRGVARASDPLIQVALRYQSSPTAPLGDMQLQPGGNVAFSTFHVPFVSIMGHVGKPVGHGTLHIPSADPHVRPVIHSNLLQNEEDRTKARKGIELAFALSQSPAMRGLASPLWPRMRTLRDRDAIDKTLRKWTDSGYHPCGTAPMGTDPGNGATNGRGKVFGVDALYIADASLMPTIPMGNIHLPTLMMAERVAAWLA